MGTCSRCGSWSVAGHNHKKVTGRDPNGLFGLPLNRNQSPYNENALFGLISEIFFGIITAVLIMIASIVMQYQRQTGRH